MVRFALGIVLATLAFYAWGFLYWGFGPYARWIWKPARDDAAAQQLLREQFPENGLYYVPGFRTPAGTATDPQSLNERFEAGPVAMVHIVAADGRPAFDPRIMALGFAHNLGGVVLMGLVLAWAAPALPGYGARVGFATLIGAAAAYLIAGGQSVWWGIDWTWQLYQAFYDATSWTVSALVLAACLPPAKPASRA